MTNAFSAKLAKLRQRAITDRERFEHRFGDCQPGTMYAPDGRTKLQPPAPEQETTDDQQR